MRLNEQVEDWPFHSVSPFKEEAGRSKDRKETDWLTSGYFGLIFFQGPVIRFLIIILTGTGSWWVGWGEDLVLPLPLFIRKLGLQLSFSLVMWNISTSDRTFNFRQVYQGLVQKRS